MEKLQKRDEKALKKFIEPKLNLILEGRSKVIAAGGNPTVMYIGDIFPRKKDELRVSAMNLHVGSVYGMKVIADFRVPKDTFYITYGELGKA